jgi:hypothetical protein
MLIEQERCQISKRRDIYRLEILHYMLTLRATEKFHSIRLRRQYNEITPRQNRSIEKAGTSLRRDHQKPDWKIRHE